MFELVTNHPITASYLRKIQTHVHTATKTRTDFYLVEGCTSVRFPDGFNCTHFEPIHLGEGNHAVKITEYNAEGQIVESGIVAWFEEVEKCDCYYDTIGILHGCDDCNSAEWQDESSGIPAMVDTGDGAPQYTFAPTGQLSLL